MLPRSRRCLLAVTLLCAVTAPLPVAHAQVPLRCRDFARFDERWQRCVAPDGTVEIHRVGVLFHT